MDWDDALPWFLILMIGSVVLAVRSFVTDRRLKRLIDGLTDKVGMYEHRLFRLDERVTALAGGPPIASPEAPIAGVPIAEARPGLP